VKTLVSRPRCEAPAIPEMESKIMGNNPAPDTPLKNTLNPLYDTNATKRSLNCSRWKLWDLCRNDPEFPKPREIAGKNQWFGNEIEAYKKSRPRRIYAAVVAVLAVVSLAAPFLADFLA